MSSRVLFYLPLYRHLVDLALRSTGKAVGEHGIKWGRKIFLDFEYADDLSILDESISKINEFLEVLRVQFARIGLKINLKKTKSLGARNK